LKAWLCYLKTNPHDHIEFKIKLNELGELSRAAGYEVIGHTAQVRRKESSALMMGKGKLDEIKQLASDGNADVVIFYNVLTSKQKYNLTKNLQKEVLDRYDLTLKIFDLSSSDRLSKLQIELAKLVKEIPYEKLVTSIRYKTGREHPGPRSLGEYSYHEIVANLLKRKSKIVKEIERRKAEKTMQLSRRKKMKVPTVCITGYYNAGKTSLFNALTNLNKTVGPRPFTTLSSKYYLLPNGDLTVFLVDTIGFVADLDPRLIASFNLTLEDIWASDLVILVVDASDDLDLMRLRVKTSLDLLRTLGIGDRRIIVAFNKSDLLTGRQELMEKLNSLSPLIQDFKYCVVSAKMRVGLDRFVDLIGSHLSTENQAPA